MPIMSLQAAYDQARHWLESNELNRAIGLAQYILEHYPDNLDAYRILGEAYLANRQLDRAQEAFERVLRSDPENIPAHVGLGITYERQGKLDHAMAEFEQALEIKPDMPELRSQLLRLYTDAWGSEHAHLRLSRAGLARLYAKGHMLPQAINEFRQVISEHPDRFDAMVAMAEALWRDGQEEAAIGLCREILAKRPESLKANLLLGYLEMAAGQPEGEQAWQAAHQMDPYQSVARALFETLPPNASDEPTIEEWDEDVWRQRRAEEQQERIAATRPMEAVTPVGTAIESVTNGSRREVPPPPSHPTVPAVDTDDFLAGLLAITPPPLPTPIGEPEEDFDLDMAPFSLDDLEAEQRTPAQSVPFTTPPPQAEEEPTMTPFSLADLGLSDEEIGNLDSLNEAPAPAAQPAEGEPAMTPFSLADLGLSDEEIASLDSLNEAPAAAPAPAAQPAEEPGEPAMTPFSLADLGLSDEEIASLEGASAPVPTEARPSAPASPIEEEPDVTPFSLADLGLSEDEIAGLEGLGMDRESAPRRAAGDRAAEAAFPSQPSRGDLTTSDEEALDADMLPTDLQPFSLDELDLGEGEPGASIGGLGSSLQPFSIDEPPTQRPRVSGFAADETFDVAPDEAESTPDTGGYSWQQPSQKPHTSFLKPPRDEPQSESIFSKLKQRHIQEGPSQDTAPPPASIREDEHLGLFSMDNVSLRDDEEDAGQAASAESTPAASLQLQTPPSQPPAGPPAGTHEHMGRDESAAPVEAENIQEAVEAGQIQPFSLADLGLSEEEIAAFGLGDLGSSAAAPPEPEVAQPPAPEVTPLQPGPDPDSGSALDEFDLAAPESVAPEPAAQLHITEDEDLLPAADELQPFSLSDLGLSEEEIVALGLGPTSEPEEAVVSELGLTEEELEGLDLGDLHWNQQPPTPPSPARPQPSAPAAEEQLTTSGDLMLDRLIALGREQGYVDISDIMAAVEDPEAEAERIEEIGQRLHEAHIEIRDGDEVIDMEAEYTEEEEAPAETEPEAIEPAAAASEEPAMTPFSLHDLGLSDDEIAAFGLAEEVASPTPAPATPPSSQDEEPPMTPFSLHDLGLSDEEIAALGLGGEAPAAPQLEEPPAAAEPMAAPGQPDEEPAMTPFSLHDLGLSDEEIAALGLGGEAPAAPQPEEPPTVAEEAEPPFSPPAPEPAAAQETEEPVITPFSLHDLGLSDEEIAALGLGGEAPAAPQPEEPPTVAEEAEPPFSPAAPEPAAAQETEEPSMLPFSLDDLDQSDQEGPGEAVAAAPTEQPAAPPPEATPEAAVPEPPRMAAAPVARPTPPVAAPARPPAASSNQLLDAYLGRLEAEPENHVLRLSIARAGGQLGMTEFAMQQYRRLIKQDVLLDQIVDDLNDLISDAEDRQLLKRLHRTLGDVYTKQGRLAEAMDEYSWVPAGS